MYQALGRGTPVIAGVNPGMSSVLRETGAGVALETDGKSRADVDKGMRRFFDNRAHYVERARISKGRFRWETQDMPDPAPRRQLQS
jgi:hypothetical protein